jgi:hypothetical protein
MNALYMFYPTHRRSFAMKRYLPVLAAGILFTMLAASPVKAEVNVSIGIGIPPIVVSAPPAVVIIPNTYVYIAPDLQEDVFFYRGYWWRTHERNWYRARAVGGPWVFITFERTPRALRHLPPRSHYREHHPGLDRIDHDRVRKNWRRWERERYWDRHESWKGHKQERRGRDRDRDHDRGDRGKHGGRD